jgi:hypothetical protein
VPLLDESAAGLGADHAHAAGDQDFHGCSWEAVDGFMLEC